MADEIKALDGKTTVDDKLVFEPSRLSYEAARCIAEKIARRISERTREQTVVIASAQLLADLSNLVAIVAELHELVAEYERLATAGHALPHAPAPTDGDTTRSSGVGAGFVPATILAKLNPVLGAATAGVQGALALVSLFRQDVDYKGVPVSIDSVAFEMELASRIKMHKAREVIIPDFAVFESTSSGADSLHTMLGKTAAARAHAVRALGGKGSPAPHKGAAPASPMTLDAAVALLAALDARMTELRTALAKSEVDGAGLTMLARLYRAESIRARSPMFVHARVVSAGGSNRIEKSLFRTLFTGDGLSASGGAVVSWAVLSEHGSIEDGGVFSETMAAHSAKVPDVSAVIH